MQELASISENRASEAPLPRVPFLCDTENIYTESVSSIEIKSATIADTVPIAALYKGPGYPVDYLQFVKECVQGYPSAVSYDDDQCIGFAYANRFAPDVLELDNLYVAQTHRNRGLGTALLQYIEKEASKDYKGIILVNSSLYSRNEAKAPATGFYQRNGYSLVFATVNSKIFTKALE